MPSRTLATIPKTYAELLRCVKHAWFTGREESEMLWVRTYHVVGRYINVHLLHGHPRADHGAGMYASLAADSGISERSLREYAQFERQFPNWRTCAKLGWSRSRLLCQIDDPALREQLRRDALKHDWVVHQLESRVRALNAAGNGGAEENEAGAPTDGAATLVVSPVRLLTPRRGVAGRYRVVARGDRLRIDVGFKEYLRLSAAQERHRTAGEFVDVDPDGNVRAAAEGRASELFTYKVEVLRVIDGDTLEVGVELPHYVMQEKLRLRGVDCPEMDTAEGKAAKRVVEALVAESAEVTIVTSKVDKYDRYLADVFLTMRQGTAPSEASAKAEEIFLNNHLLAHGHADRMNAAAQDDWVP